MAWYKSPSSQYSVTSITSAWFVAADVHNLCVGILYPIFTGQSPQKGSLRPQPADQATVESRYSDINALDFSAEPTLSYALQDLLQRGANRQITTADQFALGLSDAAGSTFSLSAVRRLLTDVRSGSGAGNEAGLEFC